MDKDFDYTVDLSNYSVKEACLWLLSRLDVPNPTDQPYALPYCSYVTSWHEAVPLAAIVMAQSPYPNAIFPQIAAAMSYDPEKCKKIMNKDMPPTVAILANDLKIHAGLDKEDTINSVMNGWALIHKGILLVNCAVFKPYGTAGAFDECMNQINVITRMLQETEKYGERTVDIIAYGAGQAMASELTKCFKSNIIKLTKYTSSHPASLAYRMDDFNSLDCHMDSPSTSKVIAKYFSNHVAYAHTMARKSEAEIKAQRQLDNIRSLGEQLIPFKEISERHVDEMKNLLKCVDEGDIDNFKTSLQALIHTGEIFTFRLGTTSAALTQAQGGVPSAGNTISKSGPSLTTTSPSMHSLSQHVGGEFKSAVPMAPKRLSIRKSGAASQSVATKTDSNATVNVSSPPSVLSLDSTASSTPVQAALPLRAKPLRLRKSSAPTMGTPVPPKVEPPRSETPNVDSPNSDVSTPKASQFVDEEDDRKTVSSIGARFRKLAPIHESSQPGSSGKQTEQQSQCQEWQLSMEIIRQLSCVEAVVRCHAGDKAYESDTEDLLEAIQSDMQNKFAYNAATRRLADTIRQDMSLDPKFDFSQWITSTKKSCATFNQCKTEFEF